jgi:hypothetical protein
MTADHVATVDWASRATSLTTPPGVFVGGEYREAEASRESATPRRRVTRFCRTRGWDRSSTNNSCGASFSQLEERVSAGAQVRVGGRRARAGSGGHCLEPTVVTGAGPERSRTGSPWRSGPATSPSPTVSRRLRTGTVWVNCYEEGDLSVPFGGVELSGFGRDTSRHALDEYSEVKTTGIHHG